MRLVNAKIKMDTTVIRITNNLQNSFKLMAETYSIDHVNSLTVGKRISMLASNVQAYTI